MDILWIGVIIVILLLGIPVVVLFKYLHYTSTMTDMTDEQIKEMLSSDGSGEASILVIMFAMIVGAFHIPTHCETEIVEPTDIVRFHQRLVADFEHDNMFKSASSERVDVNKSEDPIVVVTEYKSFINFNLMTIYKVRAGEKITHTAKGWAL